MKKFLTAALLAGGLIVITATAASAHTASVTHHEVCSEGVTETVVTFANDYNLVATVAYQWGAESASTVTIAPKTGDNNTTTSLPSHAVGTLKYHVTWSDNYRQPEQGDSTLTIEPLTDCHVVTTSSSSTSTSTSSTSTTVTTAGPAPIAPNTVAPAAEEKTVVPTEVKGVQLTAPAPVGGVQTGGGGTSQSSNHLLPLGLGLGLVGLAGLVTMQLRRRVS